MILLSSEAISDIESIREFLYVKNPDAAPAQSRRFGLRLSESNIFPKSARLLLDGRIRQIIVRFGRRGYIVRYRILQNDAIFVTRIWHGLESRR